jgi:hypothetical protein
MPLAATFAHFAFGALRLKEISTTDNPSTPVLSVYYIQATYCQATYLGCVLLVKTRSKGTGD